MNKQPSQNIQPVLLLDYISAFNFYASNGKEEVSTMLPLGTVQVIFQLGTCWKQKAQQQDAWEKRPDFFIGGPFDKSYQLKEAADGKVFSVRFKPGKMRYFTDCPTGQMKNHLVNPADLWGAAGQELVYNINDAIENETKAVLAEAFLMKQMRPIKKSPIEPILEIIKNANGICKVGALAEAANLSISRFRQRFFEEVGLSPKEFLKITRINSLHDFYQKNKGYSLTELAYQFEYFDQSHFIKEFRSVVGDSPKKMLQ